MTLTITPRPTIRIQNLHSFFELPNSFIQFLSGYNYVDWVNGSTPDMATNIIEAKLDEIYAKHCQFVCSRFSQKVSTK